MTPSRRLFGVWAVLAAGLLSGGCFGKTTGPLPTSTDRPFVLQNVEEDLQSRTARSQQPEPPARSALPAPPSAPSQSNLAPPAEARLAVRVAAWVSGRPIFDDEVQSQVPRGLIANALRLPPAQRDAEIAKVFHQTLDALIDLELLYQDAQRKLEKNPKYWEKLQTSAHRESEKRIAQNIQQNKLRSIEELKLALAQQGLTLESVRRCMQREYIAIEYLKAKVGDYVRKIGPEEVADYYKEHAGEFQQVDRVKWQNLFIAVGPKHPTLADARAFAEQVVARWRGGEDLEQLLALDDGTARANKGEGIGETREDIRPRELEPLLFAMKDGEFGPLVEMPTGVHIFRLVKRENAGVMAFDDKVQRMIENKLKNEVFDRERRHLVRELRERYRDAIVVVDQRPEG